MSVREVILRIVGDSTSGEKALKSMQGHADDTGSKFETMGKRTSTSFGMMHSSMGPLLGGMGPMTESFERLRGGVDHVRESFEKSATGSQKAGAVFIGVGAAVTGVGALLAEVGHKQEQAHVALEQAIKNTGGSYEEEAGSIKNTITHMEKFGHNAADTQEALTHGVQALGSYKAANDVMGAAVELAARSHISLTAAMDQVIKGAMGAGKALKSLGINVADVIDKQKSVTSTTGAHEKAVADLNALVEKQGNTAEMTAAKQKTAADSAVSGVKAHRDAVLALAQARKDLATLVAGPTADQEVAAELKVQQAIQGTRNATQAVIDTKKALFDLEHPDTSNLQENETKATLTQEKATLALSDAQVALQVAKQSGDSRKIEDATIAEKEAELGLIDAKKATAAAVKATAQALADAQPGSEAAKKATNAVSDAELSLRQAQQSQADATKAQAKEFSDAKPGSDAYAAAQKKVADAVDNLAATQRTADQAAQAAIAADQAATKEAEALQKAKDKVAATEKALGHAKDESAAASNALAVSEAILSKTHGIAEAQANTFGGRILALKTHLMDVVSTLGGQFGPALVKVGPLLMTLGMIMETGIIPKIVTVGLEIVGTGAMWVSTHLAMLAASVSTMIGINISTGGLLLILGAIIAGVLLVWKNWDAIWGWIKEAFHAAVDFIKGHAELLLGIFLPFLLPFYEIWKHWNEIWGGIQDTFSAVWGGIRAIGGGIGDFFTGMWDGVVGGIKWGINAVIALINVAIGFMDSIQVKVPDFIPVVGGKTFGLNIQPIPKLAAGGTALGEGWSMVGENGPELKYLERGASIVPLDKLPTGGGGGLHWTGDLHVHGVSDPMTTARLVRDELNKMVWRNGKAVSPQTAGR